jgi:acetyl esterase/lipase
MSLDEQRAAIEASTRPFPDGTEVIAVDANGVPCEWVRVPGADRLRTVVALRGGGYCLGSLSSNRHFCGLLSEHASARVLNVGFPNAPEQPFPAALDATLTAYRWLVAGGADPRTIVLAGNSAGGGLVLAGLLALRDAGDPLPAAAVALSPWTDLAASGDSIRRNAATEVLLDPTGVLETARQYADDLTHPYVSPLYGDLHGLPPLLLHVSDAEILLDDARRVAEKARAAGVDVTLEIVEGVPHVWHLFSELLPEADASLEHLGGWIDRVLP